PAAVLVGDLRRQFLASLHGPLRAAAVPGGFHRSHQLLLERRDQRHTLGNQRIGGFSLGRQAQGQAAGERQTTQCRLLGSQAGCQRSKVSISSVQAANSLCRRVPCSRLSTRGQRRSTSLRNSSFCCWFRSASISTRNRTSSKPGRTEASRPSSPAGS